MINFALSSAPSTDNPCLLILREKGYKLQITSLGDSSGERVCTYMAEKDGIRFAGNSGLSSWDWLLFGNITARTGIGKSLIFWTKPSSEEEDEFDA